MSWYNIKQHEFDTEEKLPPLPDGFSWQARCQLDYEIDSSWCGEFVAHIPLTGWVVHRTKQLLINLDSPFDGDKKEWEETYPILYISSDYTPHRHYQYWVPEVHDDPGNEDNWSHVEDERKLAILAEWGSLRRQDIQYMLENHKYMEQIADGSINLWTYRLNLLYNGKELTFDTLGGVDTYVGELYTDGVFQELAHECIVTFLADRQWWLDTEMLHTGYLQVKHALWTEDEKYWDAIVGRFNAARAFRKLHNEGEDWWGSASSHGKIGGDVLKKLDGLRGSNVIQDVKPPDTGGETTT